MLPVLTTLVLGILLGNARAEMSYEQCQGNRQDLVVPAGYDKGVPDPDYITEVHFHFDITQLKSVKEDRLGSSSNNELCILDCTCRVPYM